MTLKRTYFALIDLFLHFLPYPFRTFHLLLIVVKDNRRILCSRIVALAVSLRRIVEGEEKLAQLLEGYF